MAIIDIFAISTRCFDVSFFSADAAASFHAIFRCRQLSRFAGFITPCHFDADICSLFSLMAAAAML
jgi:hypothetical protein